MSGAAVAIPHTQRCVWPGSTPAGESGADAEVLLTAWLRPQKGGDLDASRAGLLGTTLPRLRSYVDREALHRNTDADPGDVARLSAYCEPMGIRIVETHWRSVVLAGTVRQFATAFGASVTTHVDQNGRHFRHRSGALHAPREIAGALRGVFGLHQWPRARRVGALSSHVTPLSAREIARRYDFPSEDGSGQTVAIVQMRGEFKNGDFMQCMQSQRVRPAVPVVKRIDNAALHHKNDTTKDLEAALDVQVVGALAPGARIVIYDAPDDERGYLDAIRAVIFDREYAPSVLTISFGWPEFLWTPAALTILDDLFTAAALVGVSVFCAAGDNGAELDYDGTPHVLAPAASAFVHACGATDLDGDDETSWSKTGGGFSRRVPVPRWQTGVVHHAPRAGVTEGRGVPDVAGQQLPGYRVYVDGTRLAMGGTSAIAPMWAALTARINQRLGVPMGFFAPLLYADGGGALSAITRGGNGKYRAHAGWNPCTGLGVPRGRALSAMLDGV